MAPRRSGGGGGYSISSSTCSENGAFETVESRAYIACYALFTVAYLVLLLAFGIVRKKNAAARKILTWVYVGLSILFNLFAYISLIVVQALQECGTIDYSEGSKGYIAVQIFTQLANILLLGAILLSLAPYLQNLVGSSPKVITIVNGIIFALVSALLLAYTGITSYNYGQYDDFYYGSSNLVDVANKLGAAAYILYVLAVTGGLASCIFSLTQMNKMRVPTGSLAITVSLLTICMLLWPVLIVVLRVRYGLLGNRYGLTLVGAIVFEYLTDTFEALVFVFLFLVAGGRAVAAMAVPSGDHPIYAPVAGSEQMGQPSQLYYVGAQPQQSSTGYQGYGGYQQPPLQQQYTYQAPQPYQQPYDAPELRQASPVQNGHVHELPK